METLTTCTICYCKYSQTSHIPLVLTCGHTFCKECISRVSKCPHCRKPITSTTINLIIFSITNPNGHYCEHKKRQLFCPVCACALCINCVSNHNMHGIVPINDPVLSYSISEKLDKAYGKLKETNSNLMNDLENIIGLKQITSIKEGKIKEKIKTQFDAVIKYLITKKEEIFDEFEGIFKPISSKVDVLIRELQSVIQNNIDEMKAIEEIKREKIQKQIKMIRPFKVRYINANWIKKVSERALALPRFDIDIEDIVQRIQQLGKFSNETTRTLFGLKF